MPVNGREYEFESATFKETETTTFNAKYKDGGPATFQISKAEVKEFLVSLKPGGVVLGAQFTATISYADTDPGPDHRHAGADLSVHPGQRRQGDHYL